MHCYKYVLLVIAVNTTCFSVFFCAFYFRICFYEIIFLINTRKHLNIYGAINWMFEIIRSESDVFILH